jgi:arginine/ornithine N-succinyltransferase beta subunit
LFVLEDTEVQRVVGVSAIEVAVGLTEPWYNFHVGNKYMLQNLNVYKTLNTLFLSNDHTGCSELCTLFLDPEYRKTKTVNSYRKSVFCLSQHLSRLLKKIDCRNAWLFG